MGGYDSSDYDEGDCPRSAIGRHTWSRPDGGVLRCGFCDISAPDWIEKRYAHKKTEAEVAWEEGLKEGKRIAENERLRQVVEGVAYGTDNSGGWGDCSEAKEFLKVAGIFDPTHYGIKGDG